MATGELLGVRGIYPLAPAATMGQLDIAGAGGSSLGRGVRIQFVLVLPISSSHRFFRPSCPISSLIHHFSVIPQPCAQFTCSGGPPDDYRCTQEGFTLHARAPTTSVVARHFMVQVLQFAAVEDTFCWHRPCIELGYKAAIMCTIHV